MAGRLSLVSEGFLFHTPKGYIRVAVRRLPLPISRRQPEDVMDNSPPPSEPPAAAERHH